MLTFTIRRLVLAIPTLLFISLVIFLLLELAPGDPMAQVPLTVPPEVKQQMREALGLGEPIPVRYWKWIVQFFWIEPQVLFDNIFGTNLTEGKLRVISWQTRSPVMDIVVQRIPQTLWVVGTAEVVASGKEDTGVFDTAEVVQQLAAHLRPGLDVGGAQGVAGR